MSQRFVPLDVQELNRVASAIADADGEPFNQYTAARYRSLARIAAIALAGCINDRLEVLPHGGMHTRARWMVQVIEGVAAVHVDALAAEDEAQW